MYRHILIPTLTEISYAVATAAELFGAGRALGVLSGGRLRHRRIRPLALGLYRAPPARAARTHCQVCRGDWLHDSCNHLSLASCSMAEFDSRTDEARASRHGVSTRSRCDCIGGRRTPVGTCGILPDDASLRGDKSEPLPAKASVPRHWRHRRG